MGNAVTKDSNVPLKSNYDRVAHSSKFKQLIHERKVFIIPLTIFFLVFYFTLPILTSYSTVLNKSAFGDISWAWIFAVAQFIMTWVLCVVYVKKFAKFDKQADEIIKEQLEGGEQE
ncbi:DUF485 domain-containing protein [Pseudogracilibacillus auburnensis]|uniref:Uncharacterized membrane protein (DUF485 family) n=1 Tax=Pseudogracilibacillus auburnensis TaxID=1494959 RepID=A0A2V3WAF1_9BACI|nr:uncharacterized membrane protein (DUF485 family) [Pseudogracilibacillus auburnensis]